MALISHTAGRRDAVIPKDEMITFDACDVICSEMANGYWDVGLQADMPDQESVTITDLSTGPPPVYISGVTNTTEDWDDLLLHIGNTHTLWKMGKETGQWDKWIVLALPAVASTAHHTNVRVTVPYHENMQNDFKDIRFTTDCFERYYDGSQWHETVADEDVRLQPFSLVSKEDGVSATFDVRLPTMYNGTDYYLYAVYNKNNPRNRSNYVTTYMIAEDSSINDWELHFNSHWIYDDELETVTNGDSKLVMPSGPAQLADFVGMTYYGRQLDATAPDFVPINTAIEFDVSFTYAGGSDQYVGYGQLDVVPQQIDEGDLIGIWYFPYIASIAGDYDAICVTLQEDALEGQSIGYLASIIANAFGTGSEMWDGVEIIDGLMATPVSIGTDKTTLRISRIGTDSVDFTQDGVLIAKHELAVPVQPALVSIEGGIITEGDNIEWYLYLIRIMKHPPGTDWGILTDWAGSEEEGGSVAKRIFMLGDQGPYVYEDSKTLNKGTATVYAPGDGKITFHNLSPCTITDSDSSLITTGGFASGDIIRVQRSAQNEGLYHVVTAAEGTLTLHAEHTMTDETPTGTVVLSTVSSKGILGQSISGETVEESGKNIMRYASMMGGL